MTPAEAPHSTCTAAASEQKNARVAARIPYDFDLAKSMDANGSGSAFTLTAKLLTVNLLVQFPLTCCLLLQCCLGWQASPQCWQMQRSLLLRMSPAVHDLQTCICCTYWQHALKHQIRMPLEDLDAHEQSVLCFSSSCSAHVPV